MLLVLVLLLLFSCSAFLDNPAIVELAQVRVPEVFVFQVLVLLLLFSFS